MSCSKSELKNEKLTIVYSGNIGGQINPCGCAVPMGGYARKSTIMNAFRSDQDNNVLVIDSGALLYSTHFLKPSTEIGSRLNAYIASKMIDKMDFDAVNVSSFDLSNGVDSLLAIDKASSVSWLSSNLVWKDSGEIVFSPDMIIPKGNLNIGIFGVMADDFFGADLYDESSPLDVNDIVIAAKNEVSKLKDETDIIIALCYMSEKEAIELCETVSGIDIVLFSHNGYHDAESNHAMFEPKKLGKTLFLRCPDGGRVLGVAEIEVVNGSSNFKERKQPIVLRQQDDSKKEYAGEKDSKYLNTFYSLTDEILTDTEIQNEINEMKGEEYVAE
ncbi:hypothetical protein ACFL6K_00285 [Candidatus Latescibacterota bacterium]